MRRPFGLTVPIHIGTVRICPVRIELPAVGTVAVALPAAGTVAKVLGRGVAGLDDMESAELHKHRESVEDQLTVCLQTLAVSLAVAFRPMPSELLAAKRQRTNLVAVQLPVSTR